MTIPVAGRRRDVVDAGLRHALAGTLALTGIAVASSALPVTLARSGRETAATLAMVGIWGLVAIRLVRGRGGRGTALALAGVALLPLLVLGAPAPAGVLPMVSSAPAAIAVLAAVLLLPRGELLAGVVIAAQLVTQVSEVGFGRAVLWLWPPLALLAVALVVRGQLRAAADRADAAVREQRGAEAELVRARARARAQTSWQGMLHDEVAAALRAAATPGIVGMEVRRYAERALDAVERGDVEPVDGAIDVLPALRDLAESSSTPVDVQCPETLVLPVRLAGALVGAVGEALRNVDRHADAGLVRVSLERSDGEQRLVVADDGTGFVVPTQLPAGGLRISVVDRLVEAGGSAHVTSAPGAGTRVELVWPWPPRTGSVPDLAGRPGPLSRRLAMAPLPVTVAAGALALSHVGDGGTSPAALGWFAVLSGLTVLVALRAGQPMSRWWDAVALVVAGAGALATTAGLRGAQWGTDQVWPLIAIGPLLLIVGLGGGVVPAVATLAGVHLGVWGIGLHAGAEPQVLAMVLLLSSLVVLVGFRMQTVVQRLAAVVDRAEAASDAQLVRAWQRSAARQVRGRRRARLQVLVLPFLRGLADGSLSSRDASVRDEAALLEQAVRDELHLPEVLDDRARAAVRRARSAGCRVRVQSDGALDPPYDSICAVVVAALDEPAPRELTVSVYAQTPPATLAVVAVPGDRARAARLEAVAGAALRVVDDQPEGTWVEVRLDDRVSAGRRTMAR
ncbi:MAG: hypothetical protein KJ792_10795 [Actinobacteria bacterium]|nr:hypothetical protein [Actinomycetota bacterium]